MPLATCHTNNSFVQFLHPVTVLQLMQIPASELLFFLFSLAEGANLGWILRSDQECMLVTMWMWLMGVACSISVLSGEAMLLHDSGVTCSELW